MMRCHRRSRFFHGKAFDCIVEADRDVPIATALGRALDAFQSAEALGLLESGRVANRPHPDISTADFGRSKITYAIQGPESGALILYFHGWGDDFRVAMPLEYPLIEAGFRLFVVHRPGFAGTTLEGEVKGKMVDWRTAAGFARGAAGFLDRLYGAGKWQASVIGTFRRCADSPGLC